jgi:hypothetical protein
MSEDRRFQNVDRFVVETFEDCVGKVVTGIDHQHNRAGLAGDFTGPPKHEGPLLLNPRGGWITLDKELRAKQRHDIAHINIPPIGAHCQTLDPFRAVHDSVGPFVGDFRVQERVSDNAFLDLGLSLRRKWICYQREGLQGSRRKLA